MIAKSIVDRLAKACETVVRQWRGGHPPGHDAIVELHRALKKSVPELVRPQLDAEANKKTWRCFFCDEVFSDEESAREHFGTDEYEITDPPGCVSPLRTDEKARLKELREAREYASKMQAEAEENDEATGLLEQYRLELGRLFGDVGGARASTPHQAWLVLEAARGEIEALKLRLAAVESGAK